MLVSTVSVRESSDRVGECSVMFLTVAQVAVEFSDSEVNTSSTLFSCIIIKHGDYQILPTHPRICDVSVLCVLHLLLLRHRGHGVCLTGRL